MATGVFGQGVFMVEYCQPVDAFVGIDKKESIRISFSYVFI